MSKNSLLFIKLFFFLSSSFIYCFIGLILFFPILRATSVSFPYSIHPFDFCISYPVFWKNFKICFILFYFFSSLIYSKIFTRFLFSKLKFSSTISNISPHSSSTPNLNLLIGKTIHSNQYIRIGEKSLYQNILITGTIGSGKTSSAIYPFAEQLISYECNHPDKKLGILCLDVKGNFVDQIKSYATQFNRDSDLIIIGLDSFETYNPLDKPNLKPSVLANRLKTILTLFSPNNSESYWLDKVEEILAEAIKLCRLYNNSYVTFEEIHKLINDKTYYTQKIEALRHSFLQNQLLESQIYDLLSAINFFEKEFFSLDDRTNAILKSEITRITNCFISDYEILKLFSPPQNKITFYGFEDLLKSGKIVVLSMNLAQYRNLSKIIASYLKLDFQTEVMQRLKTESSTNMRPVCFICDEYHEYVTSTDSDFFAQSREAKCINIVATQSYSSLLHMLNNEYTVKVIIQNLINKLWFRSDDIYTIESAQKLIGKEEKEKRSTTIAENARETNYSYFLHGFHSQNSNLSESINTYYQTDYIFDVNTFTQNLETFSCIAFLSDGDKILHPCKLKMIPYFEKMKS